MLDLILKVETAVVAARFFALFGGRICLVGPDVLGCFAPRRKYPKRGSYLPQRVIFTAAGDFLW